VNIDESPWVAVIGRALALLCMKQELGEVPATEKAIFLNSLGVPSEEIAAILGTTVNSVGNMIRSKNKGRKGRSRGK
jgi:DNA-directed RNA polymerase specialized sigma24 family protein